MATAETRKMMHGRESNDRNGYFDRAGDASKTLARIESAAFLSEGGNRMASNSNKKWTPDDDALLRTVSTRAILLCLWRPS
jgi:hypothetical protein